MGQEMGRRSGKGASTMCSPLSRPATGRASQALLQEQEIASGTRQQGAQNLDPWTAWETSALTSLPLPGKGKPREGEGN